MVIVFVCKNEEIVSRMKEENIGVNEIRSKDTPKDREEDNQRSSSRSSDRDVRYLSRKVD